MITIYKNRNVLSATTGNNEYELKGLSTDEKPITFENGTTFIEIDTGKIYMFDAVSKQWKEI